MATPKITSHQCYATGLRSDKHIIAQTTAAHLTRAREEQPYAVLPMLESGSATRGTAAIRG